MLNEWFDLSDAELRARLYQKAELSGPVAEALIRDRDEPGTSLLITRLLEGESL